jgi:hypothetical protein
MSGKTIDKVIARISQDISVKRGRVEPIEQWELRVIFSAVGSGMIMSLYDLDEESLDGFQSVSMQHLLSRGSELVESYQSLVPTFDGNWNCKTEELSKKLSEEMRTIYLDGGCILHRANRLCPAKCKLGQYESILFARGIIPGEKWAMSGLGFYRISPFINENATSISKMFAIPEQRILEWWKEIYFSRRWNQLEYLPEQAVFLNVRRRQNEPYWITKWSDNDITMAKIEGLCVNRYILLRNNSGRHEYAALEPWLTEKTAYLRLSIALMNRIGVPPEAVVSPDGDLVTISIKYLLPPEEEHFYKLYSWPVKSIEEKWTRQMSKEVYPAFKIMLLNLGYNILEA